MAGKNKVIVKIAGKDYALVGVESEEYIQKIALYVDKKTTEVIRANSTLSTAMASVLTSLNVADDFYKALQERNTFENELNEARIMLDRLKSENKSYMEDNERLTTKNTNLQLELAKREAELSEVRNSLEKATSGSNAQKPRLHVK